MTNLALLLVQMQALQAHMDAVAEAIRQELGVSVGLGITVAPANGNGRCQTCGATEDKIEDASTFGQKGSRCTHCGAEWDR